MFVATVFIPSDKRRLWVPISTMGGLFVSPECSENGRGVHRKMSLICVDQ